ncbi:MAG: hypothetical protein ACI9IV_002218 [Paracoccaceae bacterium]|jgi:hypothetical protein|tara:strand:- start:183 stop:293 length:111 start_codon:yes stop_codon:yes gene_type:complete
MLGTDAQKTPYPEPDIFVEQAGVFSDQANTGQSLWL